MEYRRLDIVGALASVLALAIAVLAYPRMPNPMATHWGADGQPDGFMAPVVGLGFMVVLVAGLWVLFRYLPRIDPKAAAYEEMAGIYEALVAFILAFLVAVQVFVVGWNLGFRYDIAMLVAPAVGLLFIGIGFVLPRTKQNWFVGVRTPWTLSSDVVWEQTHRRAGIGFVLAGIIALFGLVLPEYLLWLVLVPTFAVAAYTVAYSYVAYRRYERASG